MPPSLAVPPAIQTMRRWLDSAQAVLSALVALLSLIQGMPLRTATISWRCGSPG